MSENLFLKTNNPDPFRVNKPKRLKFFSIKTFVIIAVALVISLMAVFHKKLYPEVLSFVMSCEEVEKLTWTCPKIRCKLGPGRAIPMPSPECLKNNPRFYCEAIGGHVDVFRICTERN